jgi:P4 family phage/plasmid primase-like protien
MTTQVMIDVAGLQWLAENGAAFALPFGRTKNKFENGWPNNPHTAEEAITHAKRAGNVGILTGKHSNNIIALDRDVEFGATVDMLGDAGRTIKIIRDNAPERGKLLYRVNGDLPPTTSWKPHGHKHPLAELLSTGRHALTEPSMFETGHYLLQDIDLGILEVTPAQLDSIWWMITGEHLYPQQQQTQQTSDKQRNETPDSKEYVRQVKEAWPTLEVFKHFHRDLEGIEGRHDEKYVRGNGGLKVNGYRWFCHADSVGGDEISAWYYCKTGKKFDKYNKKDFWDTVNEMADVAGIARPVAPVPSAKKGTYTNGHSSANAKRTIDMDTGEILEEETVKARVDLQSVLLNAGINDEGNADCVLAVHGNKFLYSKMLGWLHYDGRKWTTDEADAKVDRAIVKMLEERVSAALKTGNMEAYGNLIKFCIPNKGRVQGCQYMLQSKVSVSHDEFDHDPDLLNCKNGVVNLRTGAITPHSCAQRFTYCVTVDYDPSADYSEWDEWLLDTLGGSYESYRYLQIAVGYSLSGHTSEEILFYLYGPPRSGKGTFTEVLLALLGAPVAKEVDFGTFTARRTGDSQNFDLAPLRPCRFVAASETNAYERFNEAKVKALTGGNEVYCAFKHRDHFNYRPQFKIWLSSNQPVNADPDDDAVWGRIRVIEFPNSQLGKEDKSLKHKFKTEKMLEGVLAFAVLGAMEWYKLGQKGLPEIDQSRTVKDSQRSDLDHTQSFIDECCAEGAATFIACDRLFPAYETWCERNGVEPKKQKGLTQSLKKKGFIDSRSRINGVLKRGIMGIGLRVDL